MDLKQLREPFAAKDIEWRLQSCGEKNGAIWAMCLAYVTARAIQDRLDEVCGPENWKNEYTKAPDSGILCGISIRCGEEWVTKWDGAENTDVEAVKGGLSGALKRAAVQWGIGRYLYNLEEGFATVSDRGEYRGQTKDKKPFKWSPPALPAWALPAGESRKAQPAPKAKEQADAPKAATDEQMAEIALLAMERDVPAEESGKLSKKINAGLTEAKANEILVWLRGLPVLQEA